MDHEPAIRAYLTFLEDPTKLRDEREVQRLTGAVLSAEDPIDKLKALAALKRAAQVDGEALRADFILAARPWAEEHGIPGSAFEELGVPAEVLAEAGIVVTPRPGRPRRAPVGRRPSTGGGRSPGLGTEALKDAIRAHTEPFVLADLVGEHGVSPGTVRKVVDDLIAAGEVENLGPKPDHHVRGRAPMQYQVLPR